MGSNYRGQLGLGHTNAVNTPTEIDAQHFGGQKVAAVASGGLPTLMLTVEGRLFACGAGDCGGSRPRGGRNGSGAPGP